MCCFHRTVLTVLVADDCAFLAGAELLKGAGVKLNFNFGSRPEVIQHVESMLEDAILHDEEELEQQYRNWITLLEIQGEVVSCDLLMALLQPLLGAPVSTIMFGGGKGVETTERGPA